jgi:hypothetical protein
VNNPDSVLLGPEALKSVHRCFSEHLGYLGKSIYEWKENEEESGDEVDRTMKRLPVFIHLRDAKFFHNSGQPMPGKRGIWWKEGSAIRKLSLDAPGKSGYR